MWTLAHPIKAPKVIAAYRKAAQEAGREPGEIILQGIAAADSDDQALESSREWKATPADEPYAEDVSDPAQVARSARTCQTVSSDDGDRVRMPAYRHR